MAWFFSKKKVVSKVPFPEPHSLDDGAIRFPMRPHSERTIEPEHIQEAIGVEDLHRMPAEELPRPSLSRSKLDMPQERRAPKQDTIPLFVKVDVYQKILTEMDTLHKTLSSLGEVSKELEVSEYNEENNFLKLKRALKSVHDRLLIVDKTLFKRQIQGE